MATFRSHVEFVVNHSSAANTNSGGETILALLEKTIDTFEAWERRDFVSCLAQNAAFFADLAHLRQSWDMNTQGPLENYDFKPILRLVLSSDAHLEAAMSLEGKEAIGFLDLLQSMADETSPDDEFHAKCIRCLRRLSRKSGQLPSCLSITDGLRTLGNHPVGGGGFADVWKGEADGKMVAIKALRIFSGDRHRLNKTRKGFLREAIIWRQLNCPNILELIGVSTTLFPLCLVSPWMENGNIMEYLARSPTTNRLQLITETARGLSYLHEHKMVHADLKGGNVLIDDEGHALICDLGLAILAHSTDSMVSITNSASTQGSIRWMAPELIYPNRYGLEKFAHTWKSDVYAFGCLTLEVLTGKPPFAQHRLDPVILSELGKGGRTERPTSFEVIARGLSDSLWSLIEECWSDLLNERPPMPEVLKRLAPITQEFVSSGYLDKRSTRHQTPLESDSGDSDSESDDLFAAL